jgi:hypothetical protein
LIDPGPPRTRRSTPCPTGEGMTDSPHRACPPPGQPALEHAPDPITEPPGAARSHPFSAFEQPAPPGIDVKDLRPLRGRPLRGRSLTPTPHPGAPTNTGEEPKERSEQQQQGLTGPAPSGMPPSTVNASRRPAETENPLLGVVQYDAPRRPSGQLGAMEAGSLLDHGAQQLGSSTWFSIIGTQEDPDDLLEGSGYPIAQEGAVRGDPGVEVLAHQLSQDLVLVRCWCACCVASSTKREQPPCSRTVLARLVASLKRRPPLSCRRWSGVPDQR